MWALVFLTDALSHASSSFPSSLTIFSLTHTHTNVHAEPTDILKQPLWVEQSWVNCTVCGHVSSTASLHHLLFFLTGYTLFILSILSFYLLLVLVLSPDQDSDKVSDNHASEHERAAGNSYLHTDYLIQHCVFNLLIALPNDPNKVDLDSFFQTS